MIFGQFQKHFNLFKILSGRFHLLGTLFLEISSKKYVFEQIFCLFSEGALRCCASSLSATPTEKTKFCFALFSTPHSADTNESRRKFVPV